MVDWHHRQLLGRTFSLAWSSVHRVDSRVVVRSRRAARDRGRRWSPEPPPSGYRARHPAVRRSRRCFLQGEQFRHRLAPALGPGAAIGRGAIADDWGGLLSLAASLATGLTFGVAERVISLGRAASRHACSP